MQFDNIPAGILSLLALSRPLLNIPIIFMFPLLSIEPLDKRIFAFGRNIFANNDYCLFLKSIYPA